MKSYIVIIFYNYLKLKSYVAVLAKAATTTSPITFVWHHFKLFSEILFFFSPSLHLGKLQKSKMKIVLK